MTNLAQEVQTALSQIPRFGSITPDDYTMDRLGGLTNKVFRIETGGERFILRIPGEGTEEYIDRVVEGHNAQVAADAGVSAEVLHVDPASGLMLSRCIDDIVTMSPEAFKSRTGAPARAARAFKQMHECGMEFQFRFELFAMIDEYRGHLSKLGAQLPEGYDAAVEEAGGIQTILAAHPIPLAPCHCDPLSENFLDNGERMWIVDWEYSGMNDPMWDLGDLSVEAEFDAEQDAEMMRAYFDGTPPAAMMGRMVIYKAMCDLLWTLWGLIQHTNDNPAEDFWAYSVNRFERCRALMATPDFKMHLTAVAESPTLAAKRFS